jgi:PAS domain S-box-containing protein
MGSPVPPAEIRLQELAEQFREVFENPSHIVYSHDLEGNFTSLNEAGERLTGYTRVEALGLNIRDILAPESRSLVQVMIEAKLSGVAETSYEVQVVTKAGELLTLDVDTRLQFRGGKAVGILGFARDLGGRRRYQTLLNEIAAATTSVTGDDFFQSLVSRLAQSLDAEVALAAELVPGEPERLQTLALRHRRGQIEPLNCEIAAGWGDVLRAQGLYVSEDWRGAHPGEVLGQQFEIDSVIAAPLRDSGGIVTGLLATLFRGPVPERKAVESALSIFASRAAMELGRSRAEQRARQAEYRYRSFIAFSTEAICRVEFAEGAPVTLSEAEQVDCLLDHGVIAECNDAYAQLRGMPYAGTLVGARLRDLAEAGSTLDQDLLAATVRAGYRLSNWEHRVAGDGSRVRSLISSVVAMGEAGQLKRLWCVIRDVTAERETQQALAESEQKHSALFETMAAGAVYLSASGQVTAVNPAAVEILGVSREEIMRRGLHGGWRCIREDGSPLPVEGTVVGKALRDGVPASGELYAVWNDARAEWRWLLAGAVPEKNQSGELQALQVAFSDVTELRKAQFAARENELRFRSVIESSPIAMHLFAVPGDGVATFEEANTAAQRMFQAQAPYGAPLHEAFPSLSSVLGSGIRQVREWGEVWHADRVHHDEQGRHSVYEIHAFQTSPGRVAVMYQDITERTVAEEALRKSEEQFRLLWECSHDGMGLTDEDGRLLRVNAAYCRLVGLDRPALEGQLFSACLSPESRLEALAGHSAFLANPERTLGRDAEVTLWDGRKLWLETSQSVIDSAGGHRSVLTILRDVTERRRAEEALRHSERRFRDLLESASIAGVIVDAAGKVTFCNDALLQSTGRTREEVLGSHAFRNVLPEDLSRVQQVFETVKGTGGGARVDCRFHTRDGRVRTYDWSISPLRAADGQIVGATALGVDVTEQRAMEEQQRYAQKMESLGRVAGGIAHDFNNLLTVINGYGDLALSQINPHDPLFAPLSQMRKAGQRAADLTGQLLAFGRKQVLQTRTFSLNSVVRESGELLARLLGDHIHFECRLADDLYPVQADFGQLHQVLINLVMNARDAMPQGGRLSLESRNVELEEGEVRGLPPGPYVELIVDDTGCGMSEVVKDRIFEPFFTTKEPGKGTGLGLSTAYGIIQQSGGHISVEATVGKGSCFRVLLPACQSAEPEAVVEDPTPCGGSETVLLVEDHDDVRDFVRSALEMYGYAVLVAANPDEALAIAASHSAPIHLLVADVMMPIMRGPELVLRVLRRHPETRVLYISGYSDDALVQEGVSGKGAAFLQKPFSPDRLAAKVKELLSTGPGPARVLVVDDEEDVRRYLVDVLVNAGFETAEARNGREALSRLAASPFELVITDLVMPEQEGMETIGEIRKRYPNVRIVAISGAFAAKYLRMARFLGASRSLAKPVSPEQLVQTVRELLAVETA